MRTQAVRFSSQSPYKVHDIYDFINFLATAVVYFVLFLTGRHHSVVLPNIRKG